MNKFYALFFRYVVFLIVTLGYLDSSAQSGVLDLTFGNGGKVITPNTPTDPTGNLLWSMILQPDGKIVAAGGRNILGKNYLALLRYKANGKLDSTFGTNGKVLSLDSNNFTGWITSLAIQSNGKILAALDNLVNLDLKRFNNNGSLDNTFGKNGIVRADFGKSEENPLVRTGPNGKILLSGFTRNNPNIYSNIIYLVQYKDNGTRDSSFGTNGVVFYTSPINIADMVIQPDEKIVVAGYFPDGMTIDHYFAVVRFNATGSVDSTFGVNGMAKMSINNYGCWAYNITLQPDGKMYVSGSANDSIQNAKIAIAKFNANGTPDNTFGNSGRVITSLSNNDDIVYSAAIQPNGKLIVAGAASQSRDTTLSTADFAVLRYNENGTLDSTFGKHGIITTNFTRDDVATVVQIQPDGKIIVGGVADGNRNNQFALARYETNAFLHYNTINGSVFLDRNSNGVKEAGEPLFSSVNITTTKAGIDTIITASQSGIFSLDTDTGMYTTTVVPHMPYYTAVPSSSVITHTDYFNTDNLSFAVMAIPGKRDAAIHLIPSTARPGFPVSYYLLYHNQGTDTVSTGTVQFIKDNRLTFNSALPAPSSISGDTIRWNYNNLKPQDTASMTINLTVLAPPTVSIGDTLRSSATITTGITDNTPADNIDVLAQKVQGSFDPNDKREIHGGAIHMAQVANGDYLQYTIRFQNTGTDTAFNVYIRDTLDSRLDWSTLRMITASHQYQLTINDGSRCSWAFRNINLVDSNSNEAASHGYLTYVIKVKPSVAIGDIISNRAAIYFDYNLPVITNTEITTVVADILPLRLLSFAAKRNGKLILLTWSTNSEVNFDRFELQRSTNGREFKTISTTTAKGETVMNDYQYTDALTGSLATAHYIYYRLRMIDKDGRYEYSPVRKILNTPTILVSVFPNPAKDHLYLQMESDRTKNMQLQVITKEGRVVMTQNFILQQGVSGRSINVALLASGNYFLKLTEDGETNVEVFEKL